MPNTSKTFAIITDFGFDFSVASMKALILRNFPDAQIVDIDHSVKPFSILSGAFVIDKIYKYFPDGTIFICVVDPGVGSKREPICIDTGTYTFIGPNNGLFHYLLSNKDLSCKTYVIKDGFRPTKSSTFHGRDLFTPAAIEIANGHFSIMESIDTDRLVFLPMLDHGESVIVYIDGFGNIKTNIALEDDFDEQKFLSIRIGDVSYQITVSDTFSHVAGGELLCYRGSNDTLEIAANLASAKDVLKVSVGDRVLIEK